MNENQNTEFRLSGSSTILEYIKKFSATEKVIFGILAVLAIVSALIMTAQANSYFMVEVPAIGGTLREGLVGLPHTINPVLAITDVDRDISSLVFSGLTKVKDGAIVPDLARDWNVSPDGLTYTFTLRSGITFQDGSPITASDVVFTIDKIKNTTLKSPKAADWIGITATATSPTIVVFNLKQPYSSFLLNTSVGIIPMKIWGHVSDDQFIFSEYNIKPIGSGPYRVTAVDRDQGGIPTNYHLESWNSYDHQPRITNIVFTFFPDMDHALKAINNNSIDSLSSVPPAAAHDLATNKKEPYKVVSTPLNRVFGVFFNQNKNTSLADPIIRKALDMSVDRQAIIKNVLDGYGVPVTTVLPPGLNEGYINDTVPQDMVGAQNLLNKNGWKVGANGMIGKKASKKSATTTVSFTLYTADSPDLKQVADIIKSNWKAIGIDVTVKVLDPTELYQNIIRTREYDALLFGQAVAKPTDFYAFWHSSQRNAPGLNIALYTNSKVDRILESMKSATSTVNTKANYEQLSDQVGADTPAVFLYSPELIYVVPKNLQGIDMGVATAPYERFTGVSDWYIKTEKVWSIFAKNED